MGTDLVGQAQGAAVGPSDLLRTKVLRPAAAAGLIERSRLDDLLSSGVTRRLTLVSAPAGYGKTTLLAGWCRRAAQDGAAVAWLSLEGSENDPALFWRYVCAALRAAGSQVGVGAEAVLCVPGSLLTGVVGSLTNELAAQPSPMVLVLDDYHLIREPECHQLVTLFVDRAPANVRVVIAARADPPLALGSIRGAGQLTEIRARDLRLTADEAAELVQVGDGLELGDGELLALVARTEGWVAGLHLAVVWLRGEPDRGEAIARFAGDNRHVVDFLAEQVLAGLDPRLERFLLRTSILGRMSASLCEAVTGDADAAALLAQAERANLFLVALDGRREWYRYHHLFGELLQAELARREPQLVDHLHLRACAWQREHGSPGDAVYHATLAGDHPAAAEIISERWIAMIRSGRSHTVRSWLGRFPAAGLAAAPSLGYIGALVAGVAGASESEVERWLHVAETALANGSAPPGPMPDGSGLFAANVQIIRTTFLFTDVRTAARDAQQVADREEGGSQWRVSAFATLAFLRYLSGDPAAARTAVAQALGDREVARRPHGAIQALATRSLLELDAGDAAKARRSAARALEVARAVGLDESVTAGLAHAALGRSLVAANRAGEGMDELRAGVDCLRGLAPVAHHAYALLSLGEAAQAGGDLLGAHRAADEVAGLLDGFGDPGILGAMLADCQRRSKLERRRRPAAPGTSLSQSELAVLRLLGGAGTRSAIAAELVISPNTVKSHTTSIYRKLGVGSREAAVAAAQQLNLL